MDESRILTSIRKLENYLSELREITEPNFANYEKSIRDKRATERLLQISIECVLDICFYLVGYLKLEVPSDEDNILNLLEKKIKSISKVREMKKFRNILVHRYGMVDNQLVHKFSLANLDDFDYFVEEILQIIRESKEKK